MNTFKLSTNVGILFASTLLSECGNTVDVLAMLFFQGLPKMNHNTLTHTVRFPNAFHRLAKSL